MSDSWESGLQRQGRSIGGRMAGWLVLFVLSLGLQLVTAAPALAASLSVSPASGVAGTTVRVDGSGFPASLLVALCWDGSGCSSLGTVLSGSGSTFSATVTIPSGAVVGGHQITACRLGSLICASVGFTVVPNATTTSTTTTVTTTTAVSPSTTAPSPVTTTTATAVSPSTTPPSPVTNTTTATGVSPSTTLPLSTTDATTTEATGPIRKTTTPSDSGIGGSPPQKATLASEDDPDSGATGGQDDGDPVVTASSEAGNEALPWLASLPWWGQVAVLAAGAAALFFVIPLIARWLWNVTEAE
jgi:hypothetical protein